MNKQEAITAIKNVQNGMFDRSNFPDKIIGEVARDQWHDVKFSFGMEYGYILALLEAFSITEDDLRG